MRTDFGRILDRLIDLLYKVSRIAVWVGGALLLISALVIGAEVVLRRAFGITTRGADEFSYYVLAVSTSWAFSYALLKKAHIRVDALYMRFGSPVRAALDVIALAVLGLFAYTATYSVAIGTLRRSIERGTASNTPWQTPLWIPQSLWFAGLLLFSFTIGVLLLRALWALIVERNLRTVDVHIGSQSAESELYDSVGEDVGFPASTGGK